MTSAHEKKCTDYIHKTDELKELVFLTLGDGDFTWSLDLGRYIRSSHEMIIPHDYLHSMSIRLIATGIDSLDEFQQKYRNYSYILREMERLNNATTTTKIFKVDVKYEVNAIVKHNSSCSSLDCRGHVVIFNHPHLGTEDAELHGKFLYHLFYSVNHYWLVPSSGVFHLTLVNGQYDRWKCEFASQRHGMKLIQQSAFVPTPPSFLSNPVYGHRRHQTGKSFASRTSGSTTYTFVREHDNYDVNWFAKLRLPWFSIIDTTVDIVDDTTQTQQVFTCSFCAKSFREGRSLKNHIISVHGESNKQKRSENINPPKENEKFVCFECQIRSFDTLEALQDHIRAKHEGIHTNIVPDWIVHRKDTPPPSVQNSSCTICDKGFVTPNDEEDHYDLFIPSINMTKGGSMKCRFCHRAFQQVRAQLQHENFCSSRLE
jgi:Domain of unknown function (DUF2431)